MLMADYIFSWTNFAGINISIFGSIIYSYAKYRTSSVKNRHEEKNVPLHTRNSETARVDQGQFQGSLTHLEKGVDEWCLAFLLLHTRLFFVEHGLL